MVSDVKPQEPVPKGQLVRGLCILADAALAIKGRVFDAVLGQNRLFPGATAHLCDMIHVRIDNRNGVMVHVATTRHVGERGW